MMALTDIDLVKKLEGRVARLATVDEVTGLLNRSGLEEALFDALRDCDPDTRALVATVDLDGFDGLNASFGHDAGDLALLGVAARLRSEVGEDALVGRYGDDEFAVAVVPAHGSPDAFADKLREVFATPFDLNGTAVVVDASIGILDAACRSCSPERLLRRAADALRSAKSSSGTSVAFFEESVASARSYDGELQVEILDDDLATNLIVEYQPIISVRAGTTFGLEALVRWRHPVRGVIGPDEFIPAAERTGRISCVTRHVLRTACHQLTAWDRTGATTDLTIGVNVSARDLVDAGFEEFVLDVLAECDLDPGRLHLEVTESHMMENLDDAVDLLAALSAAGVGISIDDFGTGYSSLSYLTRLPATTVKIDRSFISGIDGDAADEDVRRSRSMVGAVTSLAHSLGFQVVAEGVETPAQLDEVRRLGCDLVQGFVHSTPLDATSPELLGFVGNGEPWASEDR